MAANRRSSNALIVATLTLLLSGCGEDNFTSTPDDSAPLLALVQTGVETVELRIAGPAGLRALQSRLAYDPAKLKLTKVAAGKDALRLDRIFHGDLAASAGDVVVGLSDTRQVRLPARGALLSLTIARGGATAGSTPLKLSGAVGATQGGERVTLQGVDLEVKLP